MADPMEAVERLASLLDLEQQAIAEEQDSVDQEDQEPEDAQTEDQPKPAPEQEPEAVEEQEEKEEESAEVDEEEMIARIDAEIASMLRQSTALRDFISEKYAVDLSKYTSDIQLIHGLVNAAKLLGERSEKVRLFETLEERFGPEKVQALLEGRMTIKEFEEVEREVAKEAATAEAIRKTKFDLSLLEKVEVDPNTRQLVPKPGAPSDAVQRVLEFLEEREKLLNQLAADPDEFFERIVDKILRKKAEQAQRHWQNVSVQQTQVNEKAKKVLDWINARAKALFVDGNPENGFTTFGNAVYNNLNQLAQMAKPGTDPIVLLDQAYRLALAETQGARPQASARPKESPRPAKGRTPAAPAPRRKTQEELIQEGLSLVEAALYGE